MDYVQSTRTRLTISKKSASDEPKHDNFDYVPPCGVDVVAGVGVVSGVGVTMGPTWHDRGIGFNGPISSRVNLSFGITTAMHYCFCLRLLTQEHLAPLGLRQSGGASRAEKFMSNFLMRECTVQGCYFFPQRLPGAKGLGQTL
jgi:hypothetical protein